MKAAHKNEIKLILFLFLPFAVQALFEALGKMPERPLVYICIFAVDAVAAFFLFMLSANWYVDLAVGLYHGFLWFSCKASFSAAMNSSQAYLWFVFSAFTVFGCVSLVRELINWGKSRPGSFLLGKRFQEFAEKHTVKWNVAKGVVKLLLVCSLAFIVSGWFVRMKGMDLGWSFPVPYDITMPGIGFLAAVPLLVIRTRWYIDLAIGLYHIVFMLWIAIVAASLSDTVGYWWYGLSTIYLIWYYLAGVIAVSGACAYTGFFKERIRKIRCKPRSGESFMRER